MPGGNPNELIDTLRLSEAQWQELAARLDQIDPYEIGQRRHERISFRKLAPIAVAIQQPNKEWAKYTVRSRDLSTGGIGFIHGQFVHQGSACRVILKDSEGHVVCLEGTVKHCELLEGSAHHVGVQFTDEIDLSRFTDLDAGPQSEAG